MVTATDMTMTPLSEKQWMAQVLEIAQTYGYLSYHTYDSRRSAGGFPDLVLVRPPRVLFCELKTEKGRLTDTQKMWLSELSECPGVEAHVWRPSDLQLVGDVLAGHDLSSRAVAAAPETSNADKGIPGRGRGETSLS